MLMLRSKYPKRLIKSFSVPPLCECDEQRVEVEKRDPQTGEIISIDVQNVPIVRELSEKSFVHDDSADLYSVENMSKLGEKPVFANSSYMSPDLESASKFEDSARKFVDDNPDLFNEK